MRIIGITNTANFKQFGTVQKKDTISSSNSNSFGHYTSELNNNYYYPVNFTSRNRIFSSSNKKLAEREGHFLLLNIKDLPCPSCGKKMLTKSQMEKIADNLANVPPDKYLEFLGNYTEYMRPIEESVYKEISDLSQIAKDENGNQITDIRTLLVMLRDTKLPLLQDMQLRLLNKMVSLAKTLPESEKIPLMNKIKVLKSEVRKKNSAAPFRRKIMLDRISKVKIRNEYTYNKLQKIAKAFPTSFDMNSAWIVKYSGKNKYNEDWNSYDIALRFLSSSVSNTDHIIAYSIENNHDDISNYMAMHNACNSVKSNKPFLQWLNEDKINRVKYLSDYFQKCSDLINDKTIKKKKYKNYVAYATQTVYDVSDGIVDLRTIQKNNKKM